MHYLCVNGMQNAICLRISFKYQRTWHEGKSNIFNSITTLRLPSDAVVHLFLFNRRKIRTVHGKTSPLGPGLRTRGAFVTTAVAEIAVVVATGAVIATGAAIVVVIGIEGGTSEDVAAAGKFTMIPFKTKES